MRRTAHSYSSSVHADWTSSSGLLLCKSNQNCSLLSNTSVNERKVFYTFYRWEMHLIECDYGLYESYECLCKLEHILFNGLTSSATTPSLLSVSFFCLLILTFINMITHFTHNLLRCLLRVSVLNGPSKYDWTKKMENLCCFDRCWLFFYWMKNIVCIKLKRA